MQPFSYRRSTSADAARKAHAGEDCSYLAGGMTLVPTMKQGLAAPETLIDLNAIPELQGIREQDGSLHVGAMSRHGEIAASGTVKGFCPALAMLAEGIGDPAVRNRGTIGGSIANNDPAADWPAACLGMGAMIVTDSREIPSDNFFIDLYETALETGELIHAVRFPKAQQAAYAKVPNPASGYPVAGVFLARIESSVRLAVTGAGPVVFRWEEAERALAGKSDPSLLDGVELNSDDFNSDIHASAAYRKALVVTLAKRLVSRFNK